MTCTSRAAVRLASLVAFMAAFLSSLSATAAELGQPRAWGLGLQKAVTPISAQQQDFHNLLLVIITGITLLVLGLLVFVMLRFRASRNPKPSRTTHNTVIEMLWTAVPVIILVIIAVPSFKLLYAEDVVPETEMTVKVTGKQWFWTYEYEHPEKGLFAYDSYMLPDEAAAARKLPRLLGADNPLVLPVGTKVRILVTAADVLHSFAVPAFGVKVDAVTGRLNETWVEVLEEGTYYGQCSELCGTNHAYMPIMVQVVSKEAFASWLEEAQQEFALLPAPSRQRQDIELAAALGR